MKGIYTQITKFGITGLLNTVIDFGIFNLLIYFLGIRSRNGVELANIVAIGTAAANSYLMNRNWTFPAGGSGNRGQVYRFVLATAIGLVINTLAVALISASTRQIASLHPYLILNVGKILGAALSASWNFFCYRNWVFIEKAIAHCPSKQWPSDWIPGLVSIVIPAYNEARRLPTRLDNLVSQLPAHMEFEIVVVDDGSTDNTYKVTEEAARRYPGIRCIRNPVNMGKGEAVRRGVFASSGEYIVFTDADESFKASHIVQILDYLHTGAEVAIGVRATDNGGRLGGESTLRRLMGLIFNMFVKLLIIPDLQDTQCGLKGFHRSSAREIFERQRLQRFAFDVEVLAIARGLGYAINQVPIRTTHCSGSKVNLSAPFQMGWDLLRLKKFLMLNEYSLPEVGGWSGETALGVSLFLGAIAVRIPWLWQVPRYIDELKEVSVAYNIFQGQSLPLHNAAHDIGALHNYILAAIFKAFGPSIYLPRFYVAVTGAATVALVFYSGRFFYGRKAGLIASGLLLTNGMHILVTHMAWSNSTTPLFFTMAMAATMMAQHKHSGKWLALSGALWGLTLQTHSSVIIYVLVAITFLAHLWVTGRLRLQGRWYLAGISAFLACYSNMIYYNIESGFGSLRWLSNKGYTLQSQPGIATYLHNASAMAVELIRTLGSIYTYRDNPMDYLLYPTFLLAFALLIAGLREMLRQGKSLPLWMVIGGFTVIPWINQRYDFYLATRYIMPVVICSLYIMALGVIRMAEKIMDIHGARQAARYGAPWTAITLGIVVALQLLPIYKYYFKRETTNESNRLTLEALSRVERLNRRGNSVILIDKRLPVDNSPFPYLFSLNRQRYRLMARENSWEPVCRKYKDTTLLAVVTRGTYRKLKTDSLIDKTYKLSCSITIPKPLDKRRIIYVVKLRPAIEKTR